MNYNTMTHKSINNEIRQIAMLSFVHRKNFTCRENIWNKFIKKEKRRKKREIKKKKKKKKNGSPLSEPHL